MTEMTPNEIRAGIRLAHEAEAERRAYPPSFEELRAARIERLTWAAQNEEDA